MANKSPRPQSLSSGLSQASFVLVALHLACVCKACKAFTVKVVDVVMKFQVGRRAVGRDSSRWASAWGCGGRGAWQESAETICHRVPCAQPRSGREAGRDGQAGPVCAGGDQAQRHPLAAATEEHQPCAGTAELCHLSCWLETCLVHAVPCTLPRAVWRTMRISSTLTCGLLILW